MNESTPVDTPTPKSLGYRWPAEWEPHAATWLSWPHNRDSWPGKFEPIPELFAKFATTVAQFEPVHIVAAGPALQDAEKWLGSSPNIVLHEKVTNDCWIRDHGPWFLQHDTESAALVDWGYNAWGEKYPPFADDNAVPAFIADMLKMKRFTPGIIMEGGSVENNGAGTLLVTAQCLLNPNRNPHLSKPQIAQQLCQYSGAEQVLWLFDVDDGSIPGDDTDAHIDQLARFVNANTILAITNSKGQFKSTRVEPLPLLDRLQSELNSFLDSQGQPFEIIELPLPEPVIYDGQQLPASYANFYVGNGFVIVPQFGCPQDEHAVGIISEQFPQREIIGLNARDLVWGLGAFHCASMQQGRSNMG